MSEKTFSRMRRQELLDIVNETHGTSNSTKQRLDEISELLTEFEQGQFLEKSQQFLNEIQQALSQSTESSNSITEFYEGIFEGDEENESIKEEMNNMRNDWRKKVNEYGELLEKFKEHEKKYNEFYDEIKKELQSGATTVSLYKEFNKKAKEYTWARRIWQTVFMFILIGAVYWSADSYNATLLLNAEGQLFYFLGHLPIYGFLIWMVIFMGNRSAENAKLEEMYKHKEAMAKTFVGYKKAIEDLSEDDKNLLIKHMGNLLEAVNKDPSDFLSSKGEKHFLANIFGRHKSSSSD